MSYATLIIKQPLTGGNLKTYHSLLTSLEEKLTGKFKLIDQNIIQINLIESHEILTLLVERCREQKLSYLFFLSNEAPEYFGQDYDIRGEEIEKEILTQVALTTSFEQ